MFSGTAIAAIITDSQNALIAAGVVIQLQAVPNPCSNVLAKIDTDRRDQQRRQVGQRDRAQRQYCPGG